MFDVSKFRLDADANTRDGCSVTRSAISWLDLATFRCRQLHRKPKQRLATFQRFFVIHVMSKKRVICRRNRPTDPTGNRENLKQRPFFIALQARFSRRRLSKRQINLVSATNVGWDLATLDGCISSHVAGGKSRTSANRPYRNRIPVTSLGHLFQIFLPKCTLVHDRWRKTDLSTATRGSQSKVACFLRQTMRTISLFDRIS